MKLYLLQNYIFYLNIPNNSNIIMKINYGLFVILYFYFLNVMYEESHYFRFSLWLLI